MNLDELEDLMIEKIFSRECVERLSYAEKEMMLSSEIVSLSKELNNALDDFNNALKYSKDNQKLIEEKQKLFLEKKVNFYNQPLVKTYLTLFKKVNEPLEYIEKHLINIFRNEKNKC